MIEKRNAQELARAIQAGGEVEVLRGRLDLSGGMVVAGDHSDSPPADSLAEHLARMHEALCSGALGNNLEMLHSVLGIEVKHDEVLHLEPAHAASDAGVDLLRRRDGLFGGPCKRTHEASSLS